jgi:hypothetical protein
MPSFVSILLRTAATFAVFCLVQYIIPWYLLAIGGIATGAFMMKTSDDRPTSLGILIGSAVFAVFAYAMAQKYGI